MLVKTRLALTEAEELDLFPELLLEMINNVDELAVADPATRVEYEVRDALF